MHCEHANPHAPAAASAEAFGATFNDGSRVLTHFRGWQPWLILSVIVASRLLLAVFAASLCGDDGNRYLMEAMNLSRHGTFSSEPGSDPPPTAHDLPLFPLMVTSAMVVVKDPLVAARIAAVVNCILFGVAATGIYELGRRLTGSYTVAALGMLVFGCLPESFPYAVFYMPESLFLALFAWCLVEFAQFLRTGRLQPLMWSYFLWGLCVLAKPIAILLGPVLAIAAVVIASGQRPRLTRRISASAAGLLLGASVLAPWLIRNYAAFGVLGITSITGSNLFYYNYLYMLEDMGVPNPPALLAIKEAEAVAAAGRQRNNPMIRAELLGAVARKEILRNFSRYVVTTLKRHPKLYAGTGAIATLRLSGDTDGALAVESALAGHLTWRRVPLRALILQAGSWLVLGLGYACAAVGLVGLGWRRNWTALGVLLLVLLYFAVLIGPVTSTRYRFAMSPALSVAAAIGIEALAGVNRNRAPRPRRAAAGY